MQNIPRIFLNQNLEAGKIFPVDKEITHYLRRVMRRNDCLVFNNGEEFIAQLSDDDKIIIGEKTNHIDPSNDMIFCFAPIKKIDDMLNMVTQMGVGTLLPVITKRTVANHINWSRMQRIIIEAAEQSGRNSVPKLLSPIKFEDFDLSNCIVADERCAHDGDFVETDCRYNKILIGPEGGFAPEEFEKIDSRGASKISLGKTILRAEVAAVVAIAKVLNK